MPPFRNIATQRFSRLLAIAPIGKVPSGAWQWLCACDCGTIKKVTTLQLTNGETRSCGCLHQEIRRQPRNLSHHIGRRFGNLTVVARAANMPQKSQWVCQCDCGKIVFVAWSNLPNGHTKSCGCLKRELTRTRRTVHGKSHTTIHNTYLSIVQRCTNPKNHAFPDYGGRGITCEFSSFEAFYACVGDPPGPGYSLDRIDNNGPYAHGNLRWATRTTQMNNKRTNRLLTFQGETHTVAQWAKKMEMSFDVLHARLSRHWSVERALTAPLRRWA